MPNRTTTSYAVRSAVRRSHQLGAAGGVAIAVGLWITIGVYGLSGTALTLSGFLTPWAYLLVGLLSLPTVLSWAELMSWVRGTGGSYRLTRAADRPALTFFNSLAHLLGWVTLAALVAEMFSWYAQGLLEFVLPPLPDRRILALPLILFFALANLTGYRSRRRAQVFFLGGGVVVILGIAALMAPRAIGQPVAFPQVGTPGIFASIAVLASAMWSFSATFEMQSVHRNPMRVLLAGALAGPAVGLLLTLVARRVILMDALTQDSLPLVTLITQGTFLGPSGAPVMLALGVFVSGAAWEIVTLASLRHVAALSYDGWLPDWLAKRHTRYGTPWRLILFQAVAVLIFVILGTIEQLGRLSALAFLLVGISVNTAAFFLSDHADAEERTFRLPLGVLIPAAGIGTNVLLLAALGVPTLLVGAIWLGLGFALLWRRGREQLQEAQRGITIFGEPEDEEERSLFNVLVPIANLNRNANLLAFAEAIARQRGGRVVAVHVVRVPDQLPLDSGRIAARNNLNALEDTTDQMEEHGVPFHAITRLSRNIAHGILDTMAEEHPNLVVMGWQARSTPGVGLGHILDDVVANATCDVAVLRGDWPATPGAILVPMGGGPNAPLAAELAQALTQASGGQVTLLNVVRNPARQRDFDDAGALLEQQIAALPSADRLVPKVVSADSPIAGILDEADSHDAVMLGASEESFLDQALFGQVPQRISRDTDSPVAMVRRYRGLPAFWLRKVWDSVSNTLPSLEREDQLVVYQRLRRGARPNINYFVLITLSAIIATLGLLLNSPAVIIGAMLVAPLMTPIVATSIGISFGDGRTLRLAIESTLQGVLVAIFIAILITIIAPVRSLNSEILARTQPTLLDLGIALASGLAGAYAIARKEVGEALPGVAIAAALMPPICTIGIGIALPNVRVAGGATLLFITNLIAITLAAAIVFLLLGIRPPQERARQRTLQRGLTTSAISLAIVGLLLAYIFFRTTTRDQVNSRVTQVVETQTLDWENASLESLNVEQDRSQVTVTATIRTSRDVTQADIDALDTRLEEVLDTNVQVQLFVVPVTQLDSTSS